MKNIFKLLLVSLIFTACEDVEPTIYNGTEADATFLSFTRTAYNLPVVRDADGTLTITLNASTVSSVDRTYNLVIDDEASTADAAVYDFPSTITIPAGSYSGTAVVTGEDINVTANAQTIVFSISEIGAANMDVNEITINIFEVCPLEADFAGQYVFNQQTPAVMNGNTPIFLFPQNEIVTLEVGESEFERVFTATLWGGFFDEDVDFTFTLSCDQISVNSFNIPGFCSYSDPEETIPNRFTITGAANAGFYTTGDDSVITIIVQEDATASCLNAARTVTFTLTKVN